VDAAAEAAAEEEDGVVWIRRLGTGMLAKGRGILLVDANAEDEDEACDDAKGLRVPSTTVACATCASVPGKGNALTEELDIDEEV
jgi:hypothetical protein